MIPKLSSQLPWYNARSVSNLIDNDKNCAKQHIRPLYVNFGLVPSVAQLSSASYYFLCFPAAAYVHLDAWLGPYCIVEVDNFLFGLFPSVAQLSSAFHYFSCFPALQQILLLTWMVLTMFCLYGPHRPRPLWRWYFRPIRGLENVTRQNEWHFDI